LKGEVEMVDVKHEAEVAYTAEVQKALKDTVWRSGCTSWYFTKDGWNSTVYPYSQLDFYRRCVFPKWSDWNIAYTKKGTAKLRTQRTTRALLAVLSVVGAYRFHQSGASLADAKFAFRNTLLAALAQLMGVWALIQKRI
jgi:hypothetical protein